jgi:diguanylate cyclase
VKIDKSFVIPMAQDKGAATIVRSVIELATSLGLTVVAEGVEDERTRALLAAIHCDFVQGYYLSRPVPARQFTEWIRSRQGSSPVLIPGQRPRWATGGTGVATPEAPVTPRLAD